MRSRAVATVAAFVLVALGASIGWAARGPGPAPVRDALARAGHVAGAPERNLNLTRVKVPPGAQLPLHHHQGTQIARIEHGVLTYTVAEGSVTVRRGQADGSSTVVRTISAGQTARLKSGQWIVEQPSTIHQAANNGSEKVVITLAVLLEDGAPPSTPVTP